MFGDSFWLNFSTFLTQNIDQKRDQKSDSKNFNPKKTALAYEKGGATCLSVLTDKKYFGGCNEYLSTIRKITNLPI